MGNRLTNTTVAQGEVCVTHHLTLRSAPQERVSKGGQHT
jgi:hypothetical protein